jgi:hypothetical protein
MTNQEYLEEQLSLAKEALEGIIIDNKIREVVYKVDKDNYESLIASIETQLQSQAELMSKEEKTITDISDEKEVHKKKLKRTPRKKIVGAARDWPDDCDCRIHSRDTCNLECED